MSSAERDGSDIERQHITPKGSSVKNYTFLEHAHHGRMFGTEEEQEEQEELHSEICGIPIRIGRRADPMNYSARHLASIRSLFVLKGSVWDNRSLWVAMGWTLLCAVVVAFLAFVFVDDPASIEAGKFAKLSAFLNVFVGLLLGFFLSSSVNRWYACADGFLALFDAVRNLQMQFHALGIPEESESLCLRYGVLSAWLLRMELYVSASSKKLRDTKFDAFWADLKTQRPDLMTEEEEVFLKMSMGPNKTNEISTMVWTWVASRIGRMAQDGEIPPMASPTYGRILNIVQVAHGGIRSVRGAITIQAPFVYVHMLSTLVHLNNFLNGISFGLTAGTTVGTLLQYTRLHIPSMGTSDKHGPEKVYSEAASGAEMRADVQNLLLSFCFSIFGPFIYQALLEVAICIAQPFDNANEDAALPTARMTENLERDLYQGKIFAETRFHWLKPSYAKVAKSPEK